MTESCFSPWARSSTTTYSQQAPPSHATCAELPHSQPPNALSLPHLAVLSPRPHMPIFPTSPSLSTICAPSALPHANTKKKEAYHSPSFPPQHHHTKQPHPQPRLLCITPQTPTPSTSLSHWPRQLARKTDITSALKVLPIHPDLWRFFGLSQRGCVYSPFGCRSINIIFLL